MFLGNVLLSLVVGLASVLLFQPTNLGTGIVIYGITGVLCTLIFSIVQNSIFSSHNVDSRPNDAGSEQNKA